jgi:hypothetical protein
VAELSRQQWAFYPFVLSYDYMYLEMVTDPIYKVGNKVP